MYSDTLYTGTLQDDYYVLLLCSSSNFSLHKAYPSTIFGPFVDAAFYSFLIGNPGNQCATFGLTAGTSGGGGVPDYEVA